MAEFKNVEEAYQYLRNHEIETNCRYATYKASKNFGRNSLDVAKKVFWQDQSNVTYGRLEFTGVPFVILGQKALDCRFGRNRKLKLQDRLKPNIFDPSEEIRRNGSKKMNCPARCVFREIGRFPKYKITKDTTPYEKNTIATELLDRIYNGKLVMFERVIIVHLASHEDHTCHSGKEETIQEPIDPRLAKKIQDLCFAGVTKLNAIKPLLKIYVQEICPKKLPASTNRRFYPTDKLISNHVYKALKHIKKEANKVVETLDETTHPSVRIKGTEANYVPVQCFDPVCVDKSPHMHCPFCVKTESYVDPVILKAHYRVKHVDKGIEFAGLKILRCCDRCDIVGVIKGEKKFKGAHWHCYKCRNGFNRRDEAIKHYKTHFRNPQTTFQIQIAQDINQPVSQPFETEEAAACIPTDNFSVHAGLTDSVSAQTTGMTILPRGLESMVAMPGVGAVETVGVSDTQTIMIIQEDGTDTLTSMQEFCASQDSNPPDLSVSEDVDSNAETVQQLREKIAQLEKEKAEQTAHIAILSKKIEEQAEQIAAYKIREQSLLEQLQQFKQDVAVPQDTVIQDLCNQLESQHKQLIRQQITQLKHSLVQTPVHPKMIVLNANALGAQLGQTVNLQAFDSSGGDNSASVAMSLDFNSSAGVNDDNSGPIQTSISDLDENSPAENNKVKMEIENSKSEDSNYPVILVHNLQEELPVDNPIVENDGSICGEPQAKRRKEK